MWPEFKSRRQRHMWVEFVVGSLLCSERFFSGYPGFPLSSKTNISKFQFDPLCGCAIYKSFLIYLFILVLMTKIHTIPLSVMKTSDYDTLTSGFVFFVFRRVNNNKLQCEYIPVSQ